MSEKMNKLEEFKDLIKNHKQSRFVASDLKTETLVNLIDTRNELNKTEEPYLKEDGKKYIKRWYTGVTTDSTLHIDIDSQNEDEIKNILIVLKYVLPNGNYHVRKTCHGYHIYDLNYSKELFEFKNVVALNTDMANASESAIKQYKTNLLQYLELTRANKVDMKHEFNDKFELTVLCKPIGKIDYLHNILAIEKGIVTIRNWSKIPGDKSYEVNL